MALPYAKAIGVKNLGSSNELSAIGDGKRNSRAIKTLNNGMINQLNNYLGKLTGVRPGQAIDKLKETI